LSGEELEDQMSDLLVFQQFTGISYNEEIPDFTATWHFKEELIKQQLMDKTFAAIVSQIEKHGLILKKETMVDAMIIESSTRPLSNKKRDENAWKSEQNLKHFRFLFITLELVS
jgi:transposase, IS5 family